MEDDSAPLPEPSNVIALFPQGEAAISARPESEPVEDRAAVSFLGSGPGYGIASTYYHDLRTKKASPAQALEALFMILARHRERLPPDAPPADDRLLQVWSAPLERDYRATLTEKVVGSGKSATDELSLLTDQRSTLERAVLDPLTREVDGPPPLDWKGDWPDPLLVSRWDKAQKQWLELSRQIEAAKQKASRVDLESRPVSEHWRAQYDATYAALQEEYSAGPQYGLLIRRLASLDIRLRQAEESGRDIPLDEFGRLHELHLKYVAQLQRHTEVTRSENVAGVATAITRIMQELEKELKHSNPVMWGKIVGIAVKVTREEGLGMERPA